MVIKNDRKSFANKDWKVFDVDNWTIQRLRKLATKQGGHYLSFIHKFLFELYKLPSGNRRIILIMTDGFSVWDGQRHCVEYHKYDYSLGKERFKDVATCDLSSII
mgnify:CR=1 FL=1